jgi:hypothetical protein
VIVSSSCCPSPRRPATPPGSCASRSTSQPRLLLRSRSPALGLVGEARAVLGDDAFEEAQEQGRSKTFEQAVEYALENEETSPT